MLSDLTKRLMDGEENEEVDFKEDIPRDLADHVVSFANASGGYILIGVQEIVDNLGAQRGSLINNKGIALTDENKQRIQNYCENCREDLFSEMEVMAEENQDNCGVYVLHIPEGRNKPYCTSKGTYTIRRNGRKQPIYPRTLLSFVTQEKNLSTQDFTDVKNEIRIARELRHAIETHITDVINLNKENTSYAESKWDERSKALFENCQKTLSHPLIRKEGFAAQFKDNAGFGSAVNGSPVQRCDFRGKKVIGRHIDLEKGLQILDEASNYLTDSIDMKSALVPKHLLLIDQLENAIKDLINLNNDEGIGSLGLEIYDWSRQIQTVFLDNMLVDRFFKEFEQATSGSRVSGKALPRGMFRGKEISGRDDHMLRTLNILDKAIDYLKVNPGGYSS